MDDTTGLVSRIASNTDHEVRQKGLQGFNLYGRSSSYLYYDSNTYSPEVDKALACARRILRNNPEDFEELVQDVHFEISRAQQHYGNAMNAGLAYRIAKNQAGKFLKKRISLQTIVDTDAEGNPVLDEFGLARGLNSAELKRQSEDLNVTPEEQKTAKRLIWRYARTFPRFVPLEEPKGEDNEGTVDVRAQQQILTPRYQNDAEPAWLHDILNRDEILALRRLISTWQGDKRRVAEAMLEPNFTVRSIPGLDKSKVSRIRRLVLKDLRTFLTRREH